MQAGPVLSLSSPSFTTYSSSHLAEIAARVVEELRQEQEQDPDTDIFSWATQNPPLPPQETTNTSPLEQEQDQKNNDDEDDDEDEDEEEDEDEGEFEFAFVCREPESSPISADEIFYNGQIKPIYPIFNQDLLLNDSHTGNYNYSNTSKKPPSSSPLSIRRLPLRKLMLEEREELVDPPTSCSSSESEELDGVPSGTYCVWTPKPAETNNSTDRCKIKSNSTGSSKRWKFRDLLYRSHSDGKDTFAFLSTPSKKAEMAKESGKVKAAHCVRSNKELEDKRKSFLPYRKDLTGFFTNVNRLSRSLQPF